MYISSLNSLQLNNKNGLKQVTSLNQNIATTDKANNTLSSALLIQGQNNIAFQSLNTKLMSNVGKKLAPLALLTGLMFASQPNINAQNNTRNDSIEVVNVPKAFKLENKQRELNNKIFAYEIVDMLINAEKREHYLVENADIDISNKLWILNSNVKLADSTLTHNKFITAITVEDTVVKGVPKAFRDINYSKLNNEQKTKLINDITNLKNQSFRDIVNLNMPDSLDNELSSPEAIKERKENIDLLLDEINAIINNRSQEKTVQESTVASCNKTITTNLKCKDDIINLKNKLAKIATNEIDTTNFIEEISNFNTAINSAQEACIGALKNIAEHTLVIEKLNTLKLALNTESTRLNNIITELDNIAIFKEEAEKLRTQMFKKETKNLEDATNTAKTQAKKTAKSLKKQSDKTNQHTEEASTDGNVKNSTQTSYKNRNKKTSDNTKNTNDALDKLKIKQDIVNKHNTKMDELNNLRGIFEGTEE